MEFTTICACNVHRWLNCPKQNLAYDHFPLPLSMCVPLSICCYTTLEFNKKICWDLTKILCHGNASIKWYIRVPLPPPLLLLLLLLLPLLLCNTNVCQRDLVKYYRQVNITLFQFYQHPLYRCHFRVVKVHITSNLNVGFVLSVVKLSYK